MSPTPVPVALAARPAPSNHAPQPAGELLDRYDVVSLSTPADFGGFGVAQLSRELAIGTEFELRQISLDAANCDLRALTLQIWDDSRKVSLFSAPVPACLFGSDDFGRLFELPDGYVFGRGASLRVDLAVAPGAQAPGAGASVDVALHGLTSYGPERVARNGTRPPELWVKVITVRGDAPGAAGFLTAGAKTPPDGRCIASQVLAFFDHSDQGPARYASRDRAVQLRITRERNGVFPQAISPRYLAGPMQRSRAMPRAIEFPPDTELAVEYYPANPGARVNGAVVLVGRKVAAVPGAGR